jgi:hypothetical protein
MQRQSFSVLSGIIGEGRGKVKAFFLLLLLQALMRKKRVWMVC